MHEVQHHSSDVVLTEGISDEISIQHQAVDVVLPWREGKVLHQSADIVLSLDEVGQQRVRSHTVDVAIYQGPGVGHYVRYGRVDIANYEEVTDRRTIRHATADVAFYEEADDNLQVIHQLVDVALIDPLEEHEWLPSYIWTGKEWMPLYPDEIEGSGGTTIVSGGGGGSTEHSHDSQYASISHNHGMQGFHKIIGDGSTTNFSINHGLNTRAIQVQVWDESSDELVSAKVTRPNNNSILVNTSPTVPAPNSLRVVVMGLFAETQTIFAGSKDQLIVSGDEEEELGLHSEAEDELAVDTIDTEIVVDE